MTTAPHIFLHLDFNNSQPIILEKDKFHYCCKVLRKKKGDQLCIVNGCGLALSTTIETVDLKHQRAILTVLKKETYKNFMPQIWMGIPLLHQPARWEFMIEKLTELGISRLTPIITTHTGFYKFNQTRTEHIIESAVEQSKQFFKPQLDSLIKWEDFLCQELPSIKLIAYCNQDLKLPIKKISVGEKICILIGPEGDFTQPEIQSAVSLGFTGISLGSARLRSETAAITSLIELKQHFNLDEPKD